MSVDLARLIALIRQHDPEAADRLDRTRERLEAFPIAAHAAADGQNLDEAKRAVQIEAEKAMLEIGHHTSAPATRLHPKHRRMIARRTPSSSVACRFTRSQDVRALAEEPARRAIGGRLTGVPGIFQVLKPGCRWGDRPAGYGLATMIHNRFNRSSVRAFWLKLLDTLEDAGAVAKSTSIASTQVKRSAPRSAAKGGFGAGDRALARRSYDQGSRAHGRRRPSQRADADAGQRRRRDYSSNRSRRRPLI